MKKYRIFTKMVIIALASPALGMLWGHIIYERTYNPLAVIAAGILLVSTIAIVGVQSEMDALDKGN